MTSNKHLNNNRHFSKPPINSLIMPMAIRFETREHLVRSNRSPVLAFFRFMSLISTFLELYKVEPRFKSVSQICRSESGHLLGCNKSSAGGAHAAPERVVAPPGNFILLLHFYF